MEGLSMENQPLADAKQSINNAFNAVVQLEETMGSKGAMNSARNAMRQARRALQQVENHVEQSEMETMRNEMDALQTRYESAQDRSGDFVN